MASGYYPFTPGTRVRISPEYTEQSAVGTITPLAVPRGTDVLVRWDDGFLSSHHPAELLPDDN